MGVRISQKFYRMKRTHSDMSSQGMDWSSSSAGVRKPILRRRLRMPMRGGRRTALTTKQRYEVKRIVERSSELKYFALNVLGAPISSTANVSSAPFAVPQGITDTTRVGDELTWVSTKFRFEIVNSQGALSDVYNNMRLMIFQWHPNSVPTAADVLIPGPSGSPDILSTYGHDRRAEFTVLYDETFKTVGNQLAATTPATSIITTGVQTRDVSLRFARKKCGFTGASTNANEMLYLLIVTDSIVAPHPTISYQMKTFFRDS